MTRLAALAEAIDRFNRSVGDAICWLALLLVLTQFAVVLLRYLFGTGSVFLQESLLYQHGLILMLGAGATLARDGHVRVDLFHRRLGARGRALVEVVGTLLFLLPVLAAIAFHSWGYVAGAWATLEGSTEMAGIPARFLLKSTILAFCAVLALQGIAVIARALDTLRTVRNERRGAR